MLHESAIKPWQHEHWLFPKDPQFAEKAGPILDLHAGMWEGKSLGPTDYVLSMDEKTSIQARGRRHEETPPQPKQTRRVEAEYKRNGALQYLAAWDVHRGIVLGRCEKKTGIKPFGLMVDQVLEQAPYKDATQLFFIVDNGSSHRGQASVERMLRRDKRIVLVHTPIHASWLNQVEIYFSIILSVTVWDGTTFSATRCQAEISEFRWSGLSLCRQTFLSRIDLTTDVPGRRMMPVQSGQHGREGPGGHRSIVKSGELLDGGSSLSRRTPLERFVNFGQTLIGCRPATHPSLKGVAASVILSHKHQY